MSIWCHSENLMSIFQFCTFTKGRFPKKYLYYVPKLLCFLLFQFCSFCVYIHRGFNIRMPHNWLNHFQICFTLAKSCTECMSDMMARKMRYQQWLPSGFLCFQNFLRIIRFINSPNCSVNYTWLRSFPSRFAKINPLIPSNTVMLNPCFFLRFILILKCPIYCVHHRNQTYTATVLGVETWNSLLPFSINM